jgi:hypothetical protein
MVKNGSALQASEFAGSEALCGIIGLKSLTNGNRCRANLLRSNSGQFPKRPNVGHVPLLTLNPIKYIIGFKNRTLPRQRAGCRTYLSVFQRR